MSFGMDGNAKDAKDEWMMKIAAEKREKKNPNLMLGLEIF